MMNLSIAGISCDDEDPQSAMERTYQEMAARVLVTENAAEMGDVQYQYPSHQNNNNQQHHHQQQQQEQRYQASPLGLPQQHQQNFPPTNQPYSSLFGDTGGAGTLFGAPQTGSALFSSPLIPPGSGYNISNVGGGGDGGWSGVGMPTPPPMPSAALQGPPPVFSMQQPAEGLRAVLFGTGSGMGPRGPQFQPDQGGNEGGGLYPWGGGQ